MLLQRILDGTYAPGTRITESELMNEFGVSQAPIREALRELEAMRFLESQPHRGVHVRSVSPAELAEMYPVRAALEEVAGQSAALSINAKTLDLLREELRAMTECADQHDPQKQNLHDYRFHELIVEAAKSSLLLELWHSMHFEIRALLTYMELPAELKSIAESHLPILHALERSDSEGAGKAMRAHILGHGERVRARLQRDRRS